MFGLGVLKLKPEDNPDAAGVDPNKLDCVVGADKPKAGVLPNAD